MWPENWPIWRIFSALSTQWAYASGGMGPAQRTGLVYASLYPLLDREFPDPADWWQAFYDIQHCEAAALDQMQADRTQP